MYYATGSGLTLGGVMSIQLSTGWIGDVGISNWIAAPLMMALIYGAIYGYSLTKRPPRVSVRTTA